MPFFSVLVVGAGLWLPGFFWWLWVCVCGDGFLGCKVPGAFSVSGGCLVFYGWGLNFMAHLGGLFRLSGWVVCSIQWALVCVSIFVGVPGLLVGHLRRV